VLAGKGKGERKEEMMSLKKERNRAISQTQLNLFLRKESLMASVKPSFQMKGHGEMLKPKGETTTPRR